MQGVMHSGLIWLIVFVVLLVTAVIYIFLCLRKIAELESKEIHPTVQSWTEEKPKAEQRKDWIDTRKSENSGSRFF